MSSTNRGAKRREFDYYATPEWCTDLLIDHLRAEGPGLGCVVSRVFDPFAGDGAILRAAKRRGCEVAGQELDPERAALAGVPVVDSIGGKWQLPHTSDPNWIGEWVITNPPFGRFEDAITVCRAHSEQVAMLLRLNCLAGQKRNQFWQTNKPDRLCVLSKRPDFTGEGGDSCEYAWFIWHGTYTDADSIYVLPLPEEK